MIKWLLSLDRLFWWVLDVRVWAALVIIGFILLLLVQYA